MKFSYPDGSRPLDGFTIERGIGAGGFGEVYCAVSDIGKRVALKKIQRNLDIELRGVRQCINIKHINLISLWDIRIDDHGESWVVMEYVPGPSLRDIIQQYPTGMDHSQVKRWFLSAASGVAYLHQQGIVHRDLKPGNIFMDEETQIIKIGDYGLSKFMAASRRSGQTESVGTFHYMAPEIGRGAYGKEIDIYALAIILFEMLTGDVPFDGESTQEIIMKHLTDDPRLDRIPHEYRQIISRSMLKDPLQRYHSIPEMLLDAPWPEVVENCQHIVSLQTMGPFSSTPAAGLPIQVNPNVDQSARLNPSTPSTPSTPPNQSEIVMAELMESEIVFGPVKHSHLGIQGTDPNWTEAGQDHFSFPNSPASNSRRQSENHGPLREKSSNTAAEIWSVGEISYLPPNPSSNQVAGQFSVSGLPPANSTMIAGRNSPPLAVTSTPWIMKDAYPFPGWKRASDEPIAAALQNWTAELANWWRYGNISTPIKLTVLIVVSVTLILNSAWLLPVAILLGLVYLVYYTARSWWLGDQADVFFAEGEELTRFRSNEKLSRRAKKAFLSELRSRWSQRPSSVQVREVIVAMLVATSACGIFSLLGLAVGGVISGTAMGSGRLYLWFFLTSMIGSFMLILTSKFWESRPNEPILRRVTFLGLGTLLGAITFFTGNLLKINLARPYPLDAEPTLETALVSPLIIEGMPVFPAYLIYFTALMGILRWWLQIDPLRSTRLSILSVSLCLVWAVVFSFLLELPILANCITAVVISLAIQLASPWVAPDWRAALEKHRHRFTETAWGPQRHSP